MEAQLVEALCYKPEGHGLIPSGVVGIFHWLNPSGFSMAVVSTEPLREMSVVVISCRLKVAGA
jgi:hypothetical protein